MSSKRGRGDFIPLLKKQIESHFAYAKGKYLHHKGLIHPECDSVLLEFFSKECQAKQRLLEVGGGSGYFLEVMNSVKPCDLLVNVELCSRIYARQTSNKISLVGGTADKLPFHNSSFDVVLCKNLFHHLVGKTREESFNIVQQTLKEMIRVLRYGGIAMIVEQYNERSWANELLHRLSILFSKIHLTLPVVNIDLGVVVSFLTPQQIEYFVSDSGLYIKERIVFPLSFSRILSCSILLSRTGREVIIAEKV